MHQMYKDGRQECWRCSGCPGGPLEQEPWLSRRLGASSANLLCTRRMFEGRVKEKRGKNGVYRTRAGRAIFPGLPKPPCLFLLVPSSCLEYSVVRITKSVSGIARHTAFPGSWGRQGLWLTPLHVSF